MLNLYHLARLELAKKSAEVMHQYFYDVLIFTGDAFSSATCSTKSEFMR